VIVLVDIRGEGADSEAEVILSAREARDVEIEGQQAGSTDPGGSFDGAEVHSERVRELEAELEAVRAAAYRYRLLLDSASDMVSLHNIDGSFEYVSASSLPLLGYEPGWLMGRDPGEFIHESDLHILQRVHMAAIETGEMQHAQVRARRADGVYVIVEAVFGAIIDDSGELVGLRASVRDVTDRVEAEERFRLALEEAPIGMSVVDLAGRWLIVNHAMTELTGWSEEQLCSMTFRDITHPDDLEEDHELELQLLAGQIPHYEIDKRYLRPDGSEVWVRLSVSLARDNNEEPRYYICHVQDITVRRAAEEQLTAQALTDPLTGAANRRLLHDRLEQASRRQIRNGGETAVIFIDLDGLKATNDRFGHSVGDTILQEIANRLGHAIREEDTVARYGGDEFVVVCTLSDEAQFQPLLHRIEMVCSAPIPMGTEVASLGASVGGVLVEPDETPARALERADGAMYQQKMVRRASPHPS
jgi:diguanylate cyclase (GGDEF)-like protein/PAS domain S-box-containing protein